MGFGNNLPAFCTTKPGADYVSFRNRKCANALDIYQCNMIENSFFESETTIWSIFAVQNAGLSFCTLN